MTVPTPPPDRASAPCRHRKPLAPATPSVRLPVCDQVCFRSGKCGDVTNLVLAVFKKSIRRAICVCPTGGKAMLPQACQLGLVPSRLVPLGLLLAGQNGWRRHYHRPIRFGLIHKTGCAGAPVTLINLCVTAAVLAASGLCFCSFGSKVCTVHAPMASP